MRRAQLSPGRRAVAAEERRRAGSPAKSAIRRMVASGAAMKSSYRSRITGPPSRASRWKAAFCAFHCPAALAGEYLVM